MTLASYVTSIEHHEITLSTTTINSANLQSGVNVSNCVPFMSMELDSTDDDFDDILCDCYFTAGSPPMVSVERAGSGGTIVADVFVVEFDGTNVVVQQSNTNMTGTSAQVGISAVTLSKAFAVHYYKISAGDDDWDHAAVECSFRAQTSINIEAHNASGTLSGHVYVVEAQGTEWTVQTTNPDIAQTSINGSDSISAVNMGKTMVIASFMTDRATDGSYYGCCRVWLDDTTTVKAQRKLAASVDLIDVTAFVITFSGNETVERGIFEYGSSANTLTTDINAVTQAQSIVSSPSHFGMMSTRSYGATMEGAFNRLAFTDSDTIVSYRDNIGYSSEGNWEVIDFEAGGAGPAAAMYSGRAMAKGIARGIMG